MADRLLKISQALESSGAIYAGTCLRGYDGRLSMGTLLVALQPITYGDARTAVVGTLQALTAHRGPESAGAVLDCPVAGQRW